MFYSKSKSPNILFTFCSGEGGRSKPVLSGYIQKLYAATWNTTFRLDIPASGGTEMILPGEQATIKVSRLDGDVLSCIAPCDVEVVVVEFIELYC